MITEYGMHVHLDQYHHQHRQEEDDEGCAFRFDPHHPIATSTHAPIHSQPDADFSRTLVADLISDPDRTMIRQSDAAGRGSQIDSSSGKSVKAAAAVKKHASSRPQQQQRESGKRRTRQNFSSAQTKALEQSFDLVTHYPDFTSMDELSKRLNLPVEKIQVMELQVVL
jgi:hypothetical protein